jgi:hypothetical protein
VLRFGLTDAALEPRVRELMKPFALSYVVAVAEA